MNSEEEKETILSALKPPRGGWNRGRQLATPQGEASVVPLVAPLPSSPTVWGLGGPVWHRRAEPHLHLHPCPSWGMDPEFHP